MSRRVEAGHATRTYMVSGPGAAPLATLASSRWREELMALANGKKGDHPLTDIVSYNLDVFSPDVDAMVRELRELGGSKARSIRSGCPTRVTS